MISVNSKINVYKLIKFQKTKILIYILQKTRINMIFIFQQTFLGFTMKAHYEKGHSFELRKAFAKVSGE